MRGGLQLVDTSGLGVSLSTLEHLGMPPRQQAEILRAHLDEPGLGLKCLKKWVRTCSEDWWLSSKRICLWPPRSLPCIVQKQIARAMMFPPISLPQHRLMTHQRITEMCRIQMCNSNRIKQ